MVPAEKEQIKEIEKYVYKQLNISGVDTYIIFSEYYKDVLNILNLPCFICMRTLEISKRVKSVELYPAVVFVSFSNTHKNSWWFPMLCYKNGEEFYHVDYHGGWICRECWHDNGAVIMPMVDADAIYYRGTENHYPPIAPIFKKVNCKNCGKQLQRHLIMVDEILE